MRFGRERFYQHFRIRRHLDLEHRVELGQLEQLNQRDELDQCRKHDEHNELAVLQRDVVQHRGKRQALSDIVQLAAGRAMREGFGRAHVRVPMTRG